MVPSLVSIWMGARRLANPSRPSASPKPTTARSTPALKTRYSSSQPQPRPSSLAATQAQPPASSRHLPAPILWLAPTTRFSPRRTVRPENAFSTLSSHDVPTSAKESLPSSTFGVRVRSTRHAQIRKYGRNHPITGNGESPGHVERCDPLRTHRRWTSETGSSATVSPGEQIQGYTGTQPITFRLTPPPSNLRSHSQDYSIATAVRAATKLSKTAIFPYATVGEGASK